MSNYVEQVENKKDNFLRMQNYFYIIELHAHFLSFFNIIGILRNVAPHAILSVLHIFNKLDLMFYEIHFKPDKNILRLRYFNTCPGTFESVDYETLSNFYT